MKRKILISLFSVTIAGSFYAQYSKAETNVVLASVDWVNSQLDAVKVQIDEMKNTLTSIDTRVTKLESNGGSSTGTTTTTSSGSTTLSYVEALPAYVFVKNDTATVYTNNNPDSAPVGTKEKGNSIRVLSALENEYGKWYRVVYDTSNNGWLKAGDSQLAPISGYTKVLPTKNTFIYKRATTDYDVATSVTKDQNLTYLSTFQNTEGEIWFDVRTSNGIRGWLLSTEGVLR